MLARPHDEGSVYMLEAVMASVLVMAALVYVNASAAWPAHYQADGLSAMSSDILNVLQYRASSLEHPGLGFALWSADRWPDTSEALDADISQMLPEGVYYYMETPYGNVGRKPGDGVDACSRPFLACDEDGRMLDCQLILWRA